MADIGVCGSSILSWSAQNEDVQAPEPTFEIDPIDPISEWDVARGGVTVSASGFVGGEPVTIEIAGETSTVEADFFGDIGVSYSLALAAGTHTATMTTDAGSVTQNFEVVADEDYFGDPADTPMMFINPEVITASETAPTEIFAMHLLAGTTFEVRLNGNVVDTVHTGAHESITYDLTESLSVGEHTIELFHPAVTVSGSVEVVPDGDGAPAPAGLYSGTATQDIAGTAWTAETNTFPLTFTVDDEGNISDLETQHRWVCWLSPDNPTGITDLTGMPESRITTDRAFNVSWEADNLDDISVFGTVNADGSAAGSIYIHEGSCGISYLNWSATGDGDYDPSPIYDPAASVSSSSLTESELATVGVVISGEGFAPNSEIVLTVAGENVTASDADDNGEVEFVYVSGTLGVGTHGVELTSADGTATTEFTVTEDAPVYTPDASAAPASLTESELADGGVTFIGTGFPADVEVTLTVESNVDGTGTADSSGAIEFTFVSDTLSAGVYTATLTAGEYSAETTFTVIEDADPDPVYDPEATASPASLTASELVETGVTLSGTGFAPESDVKLTVAGEEVETGAADETGEVSFTYTSDSLAVGMHEAVLSSGEYSATVSFTVTEDSDPDPIFNPSISISPAELSESELADTGLTVAGEGFPAHAEVTLSVAGEVVDAALSNDAGEVEFSYTSDALGAGVYTLSLAADGDGASIASTFTVTPDEQDSGTIPATTPSEDSLDPSLKGAITAPEQAEAGDTITVAIHGADPGDEIGVWLFSTPVYLGAHTVDDAGNVTVTLPAGITLGEHRIAAWMSGSESLIGWDTLTVVGAEGEDVTGGADGENDGQKDGSDNQLAETGAGITLILALAGGMLLLLGAAFVWRRRSALN